LSVVIIVKEISETKIKRQKRKNKVKLQSVEVFFIPH
jgi:hypothetical protein